MKKHTPSCVAKFLSDLHMFIEPINFSWGIMKSLPLMSQLVQSCRGGGGGGGELTQDHLGIQLMFTKCTCLKGELKCSQLCFSIVKIELWMPESSVCVHKMYMPEGGIKVLTVVFFNSDVINQLTLLSLHTTGPLFPYGLKLTEN